MKHVTLLFIRQGDQILLAFKKRGFGAGKWNGVGGKVQQGESYKAACVRECEEEIGITPEHPVRVGHIRFFDPGDPSFEHDAHIFVALSYAGGDPHESDEMHPEWFAVDNIPYDDMWPADRHWLPHLLNGELFEGTLTANEDKVTDHHLQVLEALD